MKRFFADAPLRRKFLLLAVLALPMLLVPSAMIVTDRIAGLRTLQHEKLAVEPIEHAMEAMQALQRHRGLSATLIAGDASAAAPREAAARDVDARIVELTAHAERLDSASLRTMVQELKAGWAPMPAAVTAPAPNAREVFDAHSELVYRVQDLIAEIAASTDLVLHPEPVGYFLQLAVVSHLPPMIETMAKMRGTAAGAIVRGGANEVEAVQLRMLASTARRDLVLLNDSVKSALAADPALVGVLGPARTAVATATERLLGQVASVASGSVAGLSASQFFADASRDIDAVGTLQRTMLASLDTKLAELIASARFKAMLIVAALLATLLAGGLAVRAIMRSLEQGIQKALSLASRVSAGDLLATETVVGRDEISRLLQALDSMRASLATVVSNVREGANGVSIASEEIARGNQDLSARTESQASSLEETAASMEELRTTVQTNASSAHEADELAKGASAVASRGGEVVGEVVKTMKSIDEASKRIADIIGVIDGIAFQTNILALNAAVEAARAGEQGRGFAVVATEVRTLARRSADAAKEIKGLITASVERVQHGSALVDKAGDTMSELLASVEKVTRIMTEISHASGQQSAGVAQVAEAVMQMDQSTQQNAALVEQSAAAAESLKQQSQELVRAVQVFRVDGSSRGPDLAVEQRISHPTKVATRQSPAQTAERAAPPRSPAAATSTRSPAKAVAPVQAAADRASPPSQEATGAWQGEERRGPNRAKNVTRPDFGSKASLGAADNAQGRSGTDDDWTTF